jgi:hypothetical protein
LQHRRPFPSSGNRRHPSAFESRVIHFQIQRRVIISSKDLPARLPRAPHPPHVMCALHHLDRSSRFPGQSIMAIRRSASRRDWGIKRCAYASP